tara:strand:- start:5793 stop:6074 length:282 start_codon:yes stop_codon:yes gene_type:complete
VSKKSSVEARLEEFINDMKQELPKTYDLLKDTGLWEMYVIRVSEDIEAGLRAEAYLEEHREDLEEAVTAALGFIKERQAAVRAVVGSDESSRN